MVYYNTDKLKKTKLTNHNYYILLDFDKTITSKESLDSWMALVDIEIYGETCQKEMETLNAYYAPIEFDYTIEKKKKEQYIEQWYQKSMDLLYHYQVTEKKIQKALQKNTLKFRKGAKEFLEKMHQENIPIIILSAGIGNVIEEFLKMQNCDYDNIYIISNFIQFIEGKMQKFEAPIIHSMNKKIEGNLPKEWQEKMKERPYTILCGDMIEDIDMIPKEKSDKTITIGFLNTKRKENLKTYLENYDMVLTEEDACFQEIEKIMKGRNVK